MVPTQRFHDAMVVDAFGSVKLRKQSVG